MGFQQDPKFTEIQIETWSRKKQFEHFTKNFISPWLDMTIHLDVTHFVNFCKINEISFFHTFVFIVTKKLNEINAFKQRIRPDKVIVWEKINPSFSVLDSENNVLFCPVIFDYNFKIFYERSLFDSKEMTQKGIFYETSKENDNLLLLSCIPWVSFIGASQPKAKNIFDARPRLVWGKHFEDKFNGKLLLPFQILAHHATVDGFHMAQAFNGIQEEVNNFRME